MGDLHHLGEQTRLNLTKKYLKIVFLRNHETNEHKFELNKSVLLLTILTFLIHCTVYYENYSPGIS